MKRIIVLVFLFALLVSVSAYSQEQVSSKDAKDNIGKTIQVKGKVAAIFVSQKGNTFINFDEKSPNNTFTAAIFSDTNIDISKIKEGSILTVYGEIKEYKGKPEIVITTPEQIISVE
ncbi:MAG: OB-fold nucleic acid binding domain-containing protein [Ignavibacteria bacterium]|nr:OB-fold nucleic acid binding domain-containing protein [Ignavibacteria bacterium]